LNERTEIENRVPEAFVRVARIGGGEWRRATSRWVGAKAVEREKKERDIDPATQKPLDRPCVLFERKMAAHVSVDQNDGGASVAIFDEEARACGAILDVARVAIANRL
jgi:hypothetical protein